MTPDERNAARISAIERMHRHQKAQDEAYEKMSPEERQTRGSKDWQNARDLYDIAERDLWNLMDWNECLSHQGWVFVRESGHRVSIHKLCPLDN